MEKTLPSGKILGYGGYCSTCGKQVRMNYQGTILGNHKCIDSNNIRKAKDLVAQRKGYSNWDDVIKRVGIIAENWHAVTYDETQMPFALFSTFENAKAYRDRFIATALIEPWPMIIKDFRKGKGDLF